MEYTCPSCKSVGFGKSVLEGRCHFCDGTENGDGPVITKIDYVIRHKDDKGFEAFLTVEPHADMYDYFEVEPIYTITEPM